MLWKFFARSGADNKLFPWRGITVEQHADGGWKGKGNERSPCCLSYAQRALWLQGVSLTQRGACSRLFEWKKNKQKWTSITNKRKQNPKISDTNSK